MRHCRSAGVGPRRDDRAEAVRLPVGAIAVAIVLAGQPILHSQSARDSQPAGLPMRTSDGRPDLQGFWSTATATPLQRPEHFAGKATLTEAEAAEYEKSGLTRLLQIFPPEELNVSGDLNETY